MRPINGTELLRAITPEDLKNACGSEITFNACVHKIRNSGAFSLVYLRTGRYVFQGVYSPKLCQNTIDELCVGAYINLKGKVKEEKRANYGYETEILSFGVLSHPCEEYSLPISETLCNFSLEDNLENRTTALRHPNERAIFKITEGVISAFCKLMLQEDFTLVNPPVLTKQQSENNSGILKVKYFNDECFLSQRSQLYMQSCTAFFDRVFSVSKAYSGKRRNSARHLNEYTTLNFETAFANDIYDIMNIQTATIKAVLNTLNSDYKNELELLKVQLPHIDAIPALTFNDALAILAKPKTQPDLDPMDELKLCEYSKREFNSDFIFITHMPHDKQPFYIKNASDNTTESFVLLYNGIEISNGGIRIHSYEELSEKIAKYSLNIDNYSDYISMYKQGMPPHGGSCMGLERFVMKLMKLSDIRYASLFPRDIHTLTP